jgi:hypothetical protein
MSETLSMPVLLRIQLVVADRNHDYDSKGSFQDDTSNFSVIKTGQFSEIANGSFDVNG